MPTAGPPSAAPQAGAHSGLPPLRWWRRLRWWWWAAIAAVPLALATFFVLLPFWRVSSRFEEITFRQPSRLYGEPSELVAGRIDPPARLVEDLHGEGYREDEGTAPLQAGRYRRTREGLAIDLRSFHAPDGTRQGGLLEVEYRGNRVARLTLNGRPQERALLEPPLLASYYGPDLLERRPVSVDEVAEDLIEAVVAAEDDSFFSHSGVSASGMARALWVNLRRLHLQQGGSTLTQQLVKNLYLTQERKLTRKFQEIVLAVMLEMRYSKREILAAYLNEIYLGRGGGVNLMGMGAAARAYFGKDVSQLTLAEAATLAGMIQRPAFYSPLGHPDRARERRDWVLHRLEGLGRVDKQRIRQALAAPLVVAPEPLVRRRAPYFADAAAAEAARRFKIEDLADAGYMLFSTLRWPDQQAAQEAVDAGLAAAEKGYERGKKESLQAALVSIQPASGGILAYLGGRRYDQSQFDRVSQAYRQTGSAFKPIVYATAFESGRASPATFLEDEPLTVRMGNRTWTPKNDDGDFHGWVTARTALEHSYNLATARLALQVGMPPIVKLGHALGISSAMEPYPAVALGATAIAPIELATVYSSFAAGGVRPPVHGLAAVVDSHGKRIAGEPLPPPERVLSPETNFLVTSLLEGVLQRGTAAGAAGRLRGGLAGKTGTTNDRRDSWFAGYAPERATVVWVGYDDNAVTRLSGARAALPIWSRFTAAVVPPGGYSIFPQPPGITTRAIDPTTGLLATEYCPEVFTEFFRPGEVPSEYCNVHQGFGEPAVEPMTGSGEEPRAAVGPPPPPGSRAAAAAAAQRSKHPFLRWLRRVFGGQRSVPSTQEREKGARGERGDGHARDPGDPGDPGDNRQREHPAATAGGEGDGGQSAGWDPRAKSNGGQGNGRDGNGGGGGGGRDGGGGGRDG